jgi:hypothetical protein
MGRRWGYGRRRGRSRHRARSRGRRRDRLRRGDELRLCKLQLSELCMHKLRRLSVLQMCGRWLLLKRGVLLELWLLPEQCLGLVLKLLLLLRI